jgi:hypothetical protein
MVTMLDTTVHDARKSFPVIPVVRHVSHLLTELKGCGVLE